VPIRTYGLRSTLRYARLKTFSVNKLDDRMFNYTSSVAIRQLLESFLKCLCIVSLLVSRRDGHLQVTYDCISIGYRTNFNFHNGKLAFIIRMSLCC
jgi:hypothetical protein